MPRNDGNTKETQNSQSTSGGNRGGRGTMNFAQARFAQKIKPKDMKQTIARLWHVLGREKFLLLLVVIAVLFSTGANLLTPYYLGRIVDLLSASDFKAVGKAATILGILYTISAILGWVANYLVASVSQRTARRLRHDLFEHMEKLPLSYFDQRQNGDLMSRFTNDLDAVTNVISQSTITLLNSGMTVVGSVGIMLFLSPILTLMVLISVPLIFGLSKLIASKTIHLFKGLQKATGGINAIAEESIGGFLMIKSLAKEERIAEKFEQANEASFNNGRAAQIWSGLLMPLMNVINNLTFALIGLTGGYLAVAGRISVGVVASFIGYSRQFVRPLNELAFIYNNLMAAIAGAERVFEVLDTPAEERCLSDERPELEGSIGFNNVDFGYLLEQTVLSEISFVAKPGEQIAIVGPTGSGKTTIINLLTRFYQPRVGDITIDGQPQGQYDYSHYIGQLGVVLQDSYLFSGTIADNIRYGKIDATLEEVKEAARKARVHHMIMGLPMNYETKLTYGGTNISHGQRQLITIARAILSDPKILILDEATSSVDLATEKEITKAMANLMKGKTSFVIAHRLSTIKEADQILVIKDGRLIEQGSHAQLVAAGGYYATMIHHVQE